jgi:hypothetical protein
MPTPFSLIINYLLIQQDDTARGDVHRSPCTTVYFLYIWIYTNDSKEGVETTAGEKVPKKFFH